MRYLLAVFVMLLVTVVIILPWSMIGGLYDSRPPKQQDSPAAEEAGYYPENPTVTVFRSGSGEVDELELEEYVMGVVAAEMPVEFHTEALKAQAVLARTYAVAKLREFGGSGSSVTQRADISDDPDYDQAWFSDEEMRARWGLLSYWRNRRKIEEAVSATAGMVATYRGELIEAVYHSTSGGRTESAEEVWGNHYPYLVTVESPHEDHSPYVLTRHQYTWEEMAGRLGISGALLEASADNPEESPVSVLARTGTGRVKRAAVVNEEFCGLDLRQKLNLPSTWWEVKQTDGGVVFSVRGFGHGVGLSQYGADGLARHGSDFCSIIERFYPGVEITPLQQVPRGPGQ